jgi:uracil-DNA glycosylase
MQKQNISLETIEKSAANCTRCKLARTRNKVVFGAGSKKASIIIVGEGPGKQEDLEGKPFIGRSGKLLESAITEGIGISRKDLYITNLVKCRPTVDLLLEKDRPPESDELASCLPYLYQQIDTIKPHIVFALGAPASKTLSGIRASMTKLRGKVTKRQFGLLICSWHPSYVLRNGGVGSAKYEELLSDLRLAKAQADQS